MTTPLRIVALSGLAVQPAVAEPIAEHAAVNASPENAIVPAGSTPSESPAMKLPPVTEKVLVIADPVGGAATTRMHCAPVGATASSNYTSPVSSPPPGIVASMAWNIPATESQCADGGGQQNMRPVHSCLLSRARRVETRYQDARPTRGAIPVAARRFPATAGNFPPTGRSRAQRASAAT